MRSDTLGYLVVWKGHPMREMCGNVLVVPSGLAGSITVFPGRKEARQAIKSSVAYWSQQTGDPDSPVDYEIRRVVDRKPNKPDA